MPGRPPSVDQASAAATVIVGAPMASRWATKGGQDALGVLELVAERPPQAEVVGQGRAEGAHPSFPGQGWAMVARAAKSTPA